MEMALTISTDNVVNVVEKPTTEKGEYEFISKAVGGYIEQVTLGDIILWVNEEGKLNGSHYNPLATRVWKTYFGNTDLIFGNAVVTGLPDYETGLCQPLTQEQVKKLLVLFA